MSRRPRRDTLPMWRPPNPPRCTCAEIVTDWRDLMALCGHVRGCPKAP